LAPYFNSPAQIDTSIYCKNGRISVDMNSDIMCDNATLDFTIEMPGAMSISGELISVLTGVKLTRIIKDHLVIELRKMADELEQRKTWKKRFEDG